MSSEQVEQLATNGNGEAATATDGAKAIIITKSIKSLTETATTTPATTTTKTDQENGTTATASATTAINASSASAKPLTEAEVSELSLKTPAI